MTICHNYDNMTNSDSSTTLATDYSPVTLAISCDSFSTLATDENPAALAIDDSSATL